MEMKHYEYKDINRRGRIERVEYTVQGAKKYANVYLPFGYDVETEKRYDVLYLMHGGGGSPDAWLDCCRIKNMLDACIDSGEVKPLIVVFPTFYRDIPVRMGKVDAEYEKARVLEFIAELTTDLLPAVEGRYRGYAADITSDGLSAAREHRGFGGFSMGSCVTWYTYLMKADYFSNFLPLSGDCWVVEPMGGKTQTVQTVERICELADRGHPWHLFCATGTDDVAYDAMRPMIEMMRAHTDIFDYSEDPARGNLCFKVADGYPHSYDAVLDYVYMYLPYLFAEIKKKG